MKLRHELHQKLKAMMYEPVDELTLLNARLYAEQFINEAYKRGEYFEDGFGKIEEKDLGIYSLGNDDKISITVCRTWESWERENTKELL